MITSKYIDRIVLSIVSLGLVLVLLAMCFSDALAAAVGDSGGIDMDYEQKLFDTSQILTIDIQMDEDDWNDLLENAIDEEYYPCDVVINGTTFRDVGIRAKGNTSLSTVYNDPDTQRYSLKLEFGHYIKGQTCWGLDKLVLNNNYADATSMKEAVTYDMFAFLGADASLYNYAGISVNGAYWGCYLALEAVEDSFRLRNYGTDYGVLYKPENMGGGGAGAMRNIGEDSLQKMMGLDGAETQTDTQQAQDHAQTSVQDVPASSSSSNTPPLPDAMTPPGGNQPTMMPSDNTQSSGGRIPPDGQPPAGGTQTPSNLAGGTQHTGTMTPPDSTAGVQASDSSADIISGATPTAPDEQAGSMPSARPNDAGGAQGSPGGPGGGMSSSGGSNLNYIDDELDSYSTIWDGEVDDTTKTDHRRVVSALENISSGKDLEDFMDVDNLLKYLAVQTFVVNLDGLAGNMAHNYYLYENNGQLNLIPWDYNLAFGGFQSGNASSTINFPIDTPFTTGLEDREFFAALLENPEYLTQYHTYLRKLAEEYVDGGIFSSTVARIRSQIDTLVASDPTAFYTEDEYDVAVSTLETVVKLRAQSVEGQLDGTIPSTTDGQSSNSSGLIDCSDVDLSVMGSMMGGGGHGGGQQQNGAAPGAEGGDPGALQSDLPGKTSSMS